MYIVSSALHTWAHWNGHFGIVWDPVGCFDIFYNMRIGNSIIVCVCIYILFFVLV